MAKPIPTPEIDKMHVVKDRSQAIGEFIEWIRSEKGWEIASYNDGGERLWPVNTSIERLLAEFFGIDLDKVEKEKRALLNQLRRAA